MSSLSYFIYFSLSTSISYSLQGGMREDQEAEEGESEGKGRYQATGIDTIDDLSYIRD